MKYLRWFVVPILLLMSFPSYAQDEPDCDPAAIVQEYQPRMNEAETLDDLSLVIHDIRWDIAACNGLAFTGETENVLQVTLDPGTYIVEIVSGDYFLAFVTVVSGDCDDPFWVHGDDSDISQNVYQVSEGGCRILIEINDLREPPYEIRFLEVE